MAASFYPGFRALFAAPLAGAALFTACAGASSGAAGPATHGTTATGDHGSVSGAADAAAPERPMATTPAEATQLIGAAIDTNANEMKKCVAEYRSRKKLPHERVEVSVGIDQEGRLLGAALKGAKKDPTFSDCVQQALTTAPFPRSHAGVIEVTKSYEEIAQ